MLYTCGACQSGKHEECEGSHSAGNGVFGGRRCICHCFGRSQEQWQADDEADMKKRLQDLFDMEETSKRRRNSKERRCIK